MKQFFVILSVFILSFATSRFWVTHADYFPFFPRPLADWFIHSGFVNNQDEMATVELLLTFIVSFLCISIIFYIGNILYNKLRK